MTPKAATDSVGPIWQAADATGGSSALQVKVRAQPQDGKANAAVISLLAKALNLPKSRLSIASGPKDRLKVVAAQGDTIALEQALRKLLRIAGGDKAEA